MATRGGYPEVSRDAFFVNAHMFVIDQARKMISRTLGQSDLGITPIGIGAWAIGEGKWDTKGINESAN